jgi:hypothetical protein
MVVDPARKLPGRPGTYVLAFDVRDARGNASTTTSTFVVRPGNGPARGMTGPHVSAPAPRNTRAAGALCCA